MRSGLFMSAVPTFRTHNGLGNEGMEWTPWHVLYGMKRTSVRGIGMNGVQEAERSNRSAPTTKLSTKEAPEAIPRGLLIRPVPTPIPTLTP
jgi:hypothetical protein